MTAANSKLRLDPPYWTVGGLPADSIVLRQLFSLVPLGSMLYARGKLMPKRLTSWTIGGIRTHATSPIGLVAVDAYLSREFCEAWASIAEEGEQTGQRICDFIQVFRDDEPLVEWNLEEPGHMRVSSLVPETRLKRFVLQLSAVYEQTLHP